MKRTKQYKAPKYNWTETERGVPDVARGLTPDRLDDVLIEANQGDPRDQARLCRDILERDWSIAQAVGTRVNMVLGCPWHIEAAEDGDDKAAVALEDELRGCGEEYIQGGTFNGLLASLAGALLPGYALSEIQWTNGGNIAGFREVPQTALIFPAGQPMIVTAEEPYGVPVEPPVQYVWHCMRRGLDPCRCGLVRPLAWLFCFANLSVKDVMSFVERHGMPFIVGKVDSAGWDSERNAVKRLIRNFGPSGGGVFTKNVELELMETHSTGDVYFRLLEYLDDAVAKVVLGQTASSGDSSGLSKGDAQSKVRQDVLEADCRTIETTINAQVVKPWARFNLGVGIAPRFVIDCAAPEDRLQLAQTVASLSQAGFSADADELSVRFGLKLAKAPNNGSMGPMGPMGAEVTEASDKSSVGLKRFERLADLVSDVIEASPADFAGKLEALSDGKTFEGAVGLEEDLEDVLATGIAAGATEADKRMLKKLKQKGKTVPGKGTKNGQ